MHAVKNSIITPRLETETDASKKEHPLNDSIESRIVSNPHFAQHLRTRLLRRACPAARQILSQMTDSELIESFFANEARGREHAANLRAEKAMNE